MVETSKTVDQALRLLRAVTEEQPSTATELARQVGLNRTVVHRLLATLTAHDFVRRTSTGRYTLGIAVAELGERVESRLRELSVPVLEDLVATFGETAVLAVPDGCDAVPLEQVRGARNLVHVDYHPGMRHPLWQAAHGRAILAFTDEAVRTRVLAAVPDPEHTDAALVTASRQGYAVSHDELQSGVAGLAAPVQGPGGRVAGSIGVVAPASRLPAQDTLAAAILTAAHDIAARLGGQQGTVVPGPSTAQPAS